MIVQFNNLVAKLRNAAGESQCALGDDLEAAAPGDRTSARSAFDTNTSVVVHPEMMEHVFDYVFYMLGIHDHQIHHPIVMTETPCNPNTSRQIVNELLFECYRVPEVAYGVDAMFSYDFNGCRRNGGDGIIVSSGHNATYVLPVFDAALSCKQAKRIQLGGIHTMDFLFKSLQLKYPDFPARMMPAHAQVLVNEMAYVAEDYKEELRRFENAETLAERNRIVQYTYTPPATLSAEEVDAIEQKKEEQRARFREQAAKQREEKLKQKEAQLADLHVLKAMKADGKSEFKVSIRMSITYILGVEKAHGTGLQDRSRFGSSN